MTKAEAEHLIVDEWLKRPADRRTAKDALMFYGELSSQGSRLLSFRASGDKYQVVAGMLRKHMTDQV